MYNIRIIITNYYYNLKFLLGISIFKLLLSTDKFMFFLIKYPKVINEINY